jgi:multidrug efflux pump subunit AcrA (membrane-fusion protein)
MEKIFKLVIPILIVVSLLVAASSCSSKSSSTTAKTITTTVKRGNISLEVTGTGNLAFSDTEDLAFEIAGTVEEVSVAAGDTVTEGQELARLDTSTWDDEIESLQKALVTGQRTLASDQRQVNSKELGVQSAQLQITSAQNTLVSIAVVKYAQEQVDNLESALQTAKIEYSVDPLAWGSKIQAITTQLSEAQKNLNEVLSGSSISVSSDVALQIAKDILSLDQAKLALESAQAAVEDANTTVADDEVAVKKAQANLDKAKKLSPIITAPFSGFVTKVNVKGGDEVYKGTVAMQIADPNKFKAALQVTEDDITSIRLNGSATVSVDALNTTYGANITAIAPLATVSSGVVSYAVTVELDTTKTVGTTVSTNSGIAPPSGFSANMTMPSGMTPPTGIPSPAGIPSTGNGSGTSGTASESNSLKSGLTATVTITITQSRNVLLVPTKALTRSGQTYTVQIVKDTATETRTVVIGNSDDSNTEITSGLTEGETIQYTTSSSSSSSSTKTAQQGIGGFGDLGGGGGPPGGF